MDYILIALIILICIFGLIDLVERLAKIISKKMLTAASQSHTNIIVVPISGHVEDVELFLRGLIGEMQWNAVPCSRVILADMGMDEETLSICQTLCRANSFVSLRNGEEVSTMLGTQV